MILKGKSRAGPIDLALHLSNEIDNEKVTIRSIRGSASQNLYDAFREWDVICSQTNAKKPFYSLSVNPDPAQRDWSPEEWNQAIERIEDKLGLKGQPRAVVFHEKVGASDGELRKHCHVVWSRIDGRSLKSIKMSHDRYKLKACAKELAAEYGLELRYGEHAKSESYDHAKSQGQNRDPETAKHRKEVLTKLWNTHETPKAFEAALRQEGYVLAQGDRRAFVVVDTEGQVHSLARQIDGVKVRQVKARLGTADHLPDVETAKSEQAIRRKAENEALYKSITKPRRTNLTVEQKLFAKLERMAQRQDRLAKQRREEQARAGKEMKERHQIELERLERAYEKRTKARDDQRKQAEATGLAHKIRTIFGYEMVRRWRHRQQDKKQRALHEKRRALLVDIQGKEKTRLARQSKIMARLANREAYSIEKLSKSLGANCTKSLSLGGKSHALSQNDQAKLVI